MTLTIFYSYNKRSVERCFWQRERAVTSSERVRFVPFNHDLYLGCAEYNRAQLLDNLYFDRQPEFDEGVRRPASASSSTAADALIVDNRFPHHPVWLRGLDVYKVIRTTDAPFDVRPRHSLPA